MVAYQFGASLVVVSALPKNWTQVGCIRITRYFSSKFPKPDLHQNLITRARTWVLLSTRSDCAVRGHLNFESRTNEKRITFPRGSVPRSSEPIETRNVFCAPRLDWTLRGAALRLSELIENTRFLQLWLNVFGFSALKVKQIRA